MPRIGICGVVDLKQLILQTIERGHNKWSNYILRVSYSGQWGSSIPVSALQSKLGPCVSLLFFMKYIPTPEGKWALS